VNTPYPEDLTAAKRLYPQQVQADTPGLSIAIPALNEEAALPDTLRTVCRAACRQMMQKGGVPFEVMVVDNGSTDRTAEIAERFGARVVPASAPGISSARNAGLAAAKAPLLLWTDADARVPEQWAARHLRHYQDPNVLGVSGSTVLRGAHWSFYVLRAVYDAVRSKNPDLRYHRQYGWEGGGANVSYRTLAAERVGGYSTAVQRGEDQWMWIGLKREAEQVGGSVVDAWRDPLMRVEASGRRFSTVWRVGEEIRMHVLQSVYGTEKIRAQDYRDTP
jgi:glycosyltransferase involved in cell wall biosynthesis